MQCNTFSMSYLRKRSNDVKSKEELFLFQLQKIVFEIWRLIGSDVTVNCCFRRLVFNRIVFKELERIRLQTRT